MARAAARQLQMLARRRRPRRARSRGSRRGRPAPSRPRPRRRRRARASSGRPSRGSSRARHRPRRASAATARQRASRTPARSRRRSPCSRRAGRRRQRRWRPARRPSSADDVGNIMSGVTVAEISRSMSLPVTPASPSASRAAGSAMSVSASCSSAMRRSRIPVRSTDPLVRRVDEPGQIVVRHHPLGDVDAETGDPDPRAVGGADHRSTANVSVPRAASSSPTCAVALPRPIGPRTWSISQVSVSVSPAPRCA